MGKDVKHGAMATPVQNGCGGHSCGPPLSATPGAASTAPPQIPAVGPVCTGSIINIVVHVMFQLVHVMFFYLVYINYIFSKFSPLISRALGEY